MCNNLNCGIIRYLSVCSIDKRMGISQISIEILATNFNDTLGQRSLRPSYLKNQLHHTTDNVDLFASSATNLVTSNHI